MNSVEGKAGILAVALLLLGGAIAGQYYWRHHDKTQELAELRVLLNQSRSMLQMKEAYVKTREIPFESDKALVSRFNAISEEHAQLTKEVGALEAGRIAAEKEFVDAVTKVRAAATNLPPASIELQNGQVLSGARVQKMTDQDVTYQHDGGITRVDVKQLPDDVRDRFRQQLPPFTSEGVKDPSVPVVGKKKS